MLKLSLLNYAIENARRLTHEPNRTRVYAVVVDKKDKILSEGYNNYKKTHPRQAYFAKLVNLPYKVFLHAEISALVKTKVGKPHKMYIARVNSLGQPLPAAPCPICCMALKDSDIISIEHTV